MKILLLILTFLTATVCYGGFTSPFKSTVTGLSVPNSHDISKNRDLKIVRGQRPYVDGKKKFVSSDSWSKLTTESKTYLDELFTGRTGLQAFTDILIFKNGGTEEIAGQRQAMEKMESETGKSINVKRIHFPWKDIKDYVKVCEDTVEALQLMKEVEESKDRRLFFHCTVGEDRTGHLSGLWRILVHNWSRKKAFYREMCKRGYARGNPNKPRKVYSAIRKSLTPLYVKMAHMIGDKELTYDNLDKKACASLKGFDPSKFNIKSYRCKPTKL